MLRRMRYAWLVLATGLPFVARGVPARAAADDAVDPKAAALIAAAKAASGGPAWDKIEFWQEHGTAAAGGLSGTYQTWLDFPLLLQTDGYTLGPASGSQGWDGKQAWTTDSSKQVRIEQGREAVAAAIQGAYLGTYAFYFPGRWPAAISLAGTRSADGVVYDAIRVAPKGADPVEVWFDPKTHLIEREVQLTGVQPVASLFSDYRPAGGLQVPYRTIQRVGGNPKFDQVGTIGTLDLSHAIPARQFMPPPPPAYDAEFPAGQGSVTVPFRLINNHIYVDASIDGAAPAMFVFDTGATNVLDGAFAARSRIKVEGALPSGGFGSAISSAGLARVQSVSIGGMTLKDQVFSTYDGAGWVRVEGAPSAGLLGYEFAKRAVLVIDYGHRTMRFIRPETFRPPAGVPPIRFRFDAHIPMIVGSIDGFSGEFEIDTGSRGALTVMHPFAEAHHLVERYHAGRLATVGYGMGGPSRALLARAGTLAIGGIVLKLPVTELVSDTAGAAAATRTAGNIGGDLLKRFTVTLDYGHQRMWLQPNELAAQPDLFDQAGMWIMRADDGSIQIADISGGGAAQAAGLAVGDKIVAVNGKPAADLAVYDLREAFKKPAGTRFKLLVREKTGKQRVVRLSLAGQI